MQLQGACHCRNISFELAWPESVPTIAVRECGCTYCRKLGAAWLAHPNASLSASIRAEKSCGRYRFGTHTADFMFCTDCGVAVFSISRIDGRSYAVINVNALDRPDTAPLSMAPADFDGETTDSRLSRRQRNWIGDVRIEFASDTAASAPDFTLRAATLSDLQALQGLIAESARELSVQDYSQAQVEGALRGAFGVDTQLIRDGTYFVAMAGDRIVGCGGWSRRRTLFGGDAGAERDASLLDPNRDAAKIRAFFVAPAFARRGIGRALLDRCEQAAAESGFSRFEMMATLPGQRLYAALGYAPGTPVDYVLEPGLTIRFVPMSKSTR